MIVHSVMSPFESENLLFPIKLEIQPKSATALKLSTNFITTAIRHITIIMSKWRSYLLKKSFYGENPACASTSSASCLP